jgi:hypothetical protein
VEGFSGVVRPSTPPSRPPRTSPTSSSGRSGTVLRTVQTGLVLYLSFSHFSLSEVRRSRSASTFWQMLLAMSPDCRHSCTSLTTPPIGGRSGSGTSGMGRSGMLVPGGRKFSRLMSARIEVLA